jgi:hypothetical protein
VSKPFAWSYSALDSFEQCPRKYYHVRLAKDWPDPPSEAANWGKIVHKHIEDRVNDRKPLPESLGLGYIEPVIQRLEQAPGVLRAEYKLAINAQFQPTEFFAKDAWCRAVGDITIHNAGNTKAFALDWKTGKYKDGDAQLRLQAAVMMCHYQQLQEVGITYMWLKDKRTTDRKFNRDQLPEIWQDFLPRAKRMEQQIADKKFDPKPSGLCKKYCPVLSCEHNGRKQ